MKMKRYRQHTPEEMSSFFESAATVAAGTAVVVDGCRWVDEAIFWKWMSETVIKRPGLFDSAEAIQEFLLQKPIGAKILIQGRGAEWDWVRDFNDNPLHIGKSARLSSLAEDRNGVDAFVRKLFGDPEKIQIKTASTDVGASVNLSKYPDDTRVIVNERIAEWRENHSDILAERGDTRPVEQGFTDRELHDATRRRMDDAASGNATPGLTVDSVLEKVAEGAIIGTVIFLGVSALTNYGRYRDGLISGNEFANLLLRDSAKGALMGGSMSALNIPIQLAARSIGVGMPITLPVMIVLGYGLKRIIDPMFGQGEYKEILLRLNYTNDMVRALAVYAYSCQVSFQIQKFFLDQMIRLEQRARHLNNLSMKTDLLLSRAIEEI